jgi:hypothetical protein
VAQAAHLEVMDVVLSAHSLAVEVMAVAQVDVEVVGAAQVDAVAVGVVETKKIIQKI